SHCLLVKSGHRESKEQGAVAAEDLAEFVDDQFQQVLGSKVRTVTPSRARTSSAASISCSPEGFRCGEVGNTSINRILDSR
ncbi:MAG: hypothetical protein Q4G46_16400, partial [Propionibacteriaceae bacterium]|nr:hypothetical protein [Propionibacteriaceae bacterium]